MWEEVYVGIYLQTAWDSRLNGIIMGRFCLIMFAFSLLILILVTWQTDEKHGILYWASIVIFAIFLTTLAIMLLYFIGAIILLLITMVTDTSPIW